MPDFVQVQPDSTGKQVEATNRPTADGTGTSYRQVVSVGDDDTDVNSILLRRILEELVKMRLMWAEELGASDTFTSVHLVDEDLGL